MPKFVCRNTDCPMFGIEEFVPKTSYSVQDGQLVSRHSRCSVCSLVREEVKIEGSISVSIGKFAGSNSEERRQILKKRASAHHKKKIAPYRREIEGEQFKPLFNKE